MKKYIPGDIEAKWQRKWQETNLYSSDLSKPKKYYVLAEFSYPSGDLHIGHWFMFTMPDIYARFKQMQGFQVFFPNGFDAFGLPAENAAIKRGIHPLDWTLSNINQMKKQFASMGARFSFDHEVITCLPDFYHWNQWIFLRMLEKGLAYRGQAMSNWCPTCQTVLANEGVEAGKCWRCGTEVVQKEISQWFLKITDYADRLIWPNNPKIDWPQSVRDGQNTWIGRSEGVVINFDGLKVFTTRPDTIFGATFMVISPEHPLIEKFVTQEKRVAVDEYILLASKKTELERKENKEKTGVFTGSYVKNPLTGEDIPVWVADFVLMGYGTGAIMAVPAHDERDFEFAKKFDLPIKQVIEGGDLPYEGDGKLINSGEFNGLGSNEAIEKITKDIEEHQWGQNQIQYHIHDWSISRQRYWGTPIPVVHCPKCGIVPVSDEDLPIELPYEVDFTPKGEPPLASNKEWLNVKCPKCGSEAQRDAETMDTFVDSSWYFFRYLSPKFDKKPFNEELAKKIMPVDIYFGGAEHTLGHTLYSRFFTKFFKDISLTNLDEYALRRINHGIVLGPDGEKMSKSKGNVVNPDEQVKKYGADTVRLYLAFMMPYEGTGSWNPERVWGPYRFLQRIWQLQEKIDGGDKQLNRSSLVLMNKTIKKVGDDIQNIKSNTAIAALMEWLNSLSEKEKITHQEYKVLLLLLAPFAPHITEELWQMLGEEYSIHQQSWPQFDSRYLEDEEVSIAVQVNGKVRETIVIKKDIVNNASDVEKIARESQKVAKYLDGHSVKKVIYVAGKILNLVL